MKKIIFAFFLSFISYFLNVTPAQQIAGFSSVELQSRDLSVPGRVAAQRIIEMESGVVGGRHTHPGEELGYVIEGAVELTIDGQAPQIFKAGEVFFVAAGLVHRGANVGAVKSRLLATHIVEKSKPASSPVQ